MRSHFADAESVEEAHILTDYGLEILSPHTTHDTIARPVEANRARVDENEFCNGKVDVVESKLISFGAKSCPRFGSIFEPGESPSKLTKDDLWTLSVSLAHSRG